MEYPYIANNNLMFYAKNTATFVGDEDNLNTHGFKITADESKFTNITREYLEGKCVKIESPEHSEFVQKLAKINSVKCMPYLDWAVFGSDSSVKVCEQITIPLPPKAKAKEWPQVGDKCLYAGEVFTFLCKSPFDGDAVLARNSKIDWDVISVGFNDLLKPKTEVEILRDDLEGYLSGIAWVDTKAMAVDLLKHYNITKKV